MRILQTLIEKSSRIPFLRPFIRKEFLHYTWISIVISVLNIFFLWLFIDVFDIHTVLASVIVIGATFIGRYLWYRATNVF